MDFEVPPLVYAEDISSNGSLWNDHQMGPGKGGFLLSNGDILTLMPGVHLRFRSAGAQEDWQFTSIQRDEMRVSIIVLTWARPGNLDADHDRFSMTPSLSRRGCWGKAPSGVSTWP